MKKDLMMKLKKLGFAVLLLGIFSTAAFAERMTVNVSLGNARSGPGTDFKVLWKLEKYHPVEVVRTEGAWYYFQDFEGDKGWIHKDIVTKEPSVIAVKDKCNVRSGPGTDHGIVFTVEKGVPFKVVERKGEWIHIRHSDGDEGWIHRMLVW